MSSYNNISPFCFHHYIDSSSNTYKSYLTPYQNNSKCPNIGNGWHIGGSFYSINPSIPSVPNGLKTIVLFQNKGSRRINNITIIDNIFTNTYTQNTDTNIILFTAWLYPLPNTTPLYIHLIQNTIFLSWDKIPPTIIKDKDYATVVTGITTEMSDIYNRLGDMSLEEIISPIYVLSTDFFGKDNTDIKFQCIDGNIIPYKNPIPNLFYKNISPPLSIMQAIIYCNHNQKSTTLLDIINQDANHNQNDNKNHSGYVSFYIVISIFLIILLLIIFNNF
jgi:hypothetical protein